MPPSSSSHEIANGIGRYETEKNVMPIPMQYAGITTRAPRTRVA